MMQLDASERKWQAEIETSYIELHVCKICETEPRNGHMQIKWHPVSFWSLAMLTYAQNWNIA